MTFAEKLWRSSLFFAACLVAGCGAPSEKELVAKATAQASEGQQGAAIFTLKSALQANEQSPQLRLMLGRLMLDAGDPVSAAVELAKARELNAPPSDVVPLLARALVAQGLVKKVIDDFSTLRLPEQKAQSDLLGVVAAAHLAAGQVDKAEANLAEAAKAHPHGLDSQLVQARVFAARGQTDGALQLLDSIIEAKPKNGLALSVKGELLYRKKQIADSVRVYRQALAVDPNMASAHTALISMSLEQRDEKSARAQFEEMKKRRPNHPDTQYFTAQFAYLDNDFKAARETLVKLLRYAPENVRFLQLSGLVNLNLNDLQQAESAFNKVLQQQPQQVSTRRLLALTNLRMGREERGLELLAPLLNSSPVDVEALSMAANVLLSRGEAAEAEAMYARAARSNPDDPAVRIALGVSRLARGDNAGLEEIRQVAATDSGTAADLALVSALLSRGNFDAAQTAVDGLRRKLPGSPLPEQLAGRVAMLRGDHAAAKLAFTAALKADPVFFPAVASLVVLDVADGDNAAGVVRLEGLIKANPKDPRPRLALIELKARSGANRLETIAALRDAIQSMPNDPRLRVQLSEQYLAALDFKNALAVANDGISAFPSEPTMLDVLGRAQAANADVRQAVLTFKRLALLQPRSGAPYLRLANVYRAAGDIPKMVDSLKQAQVAASGDVAVARQAVEMLVVARQFDVAVQIAREHQKANQGGAVGWLLEGDIEQQRGNLPLALTAYRTAVTRARPEDKAAAALHAALLKARRTADAEGFLASYSKSKPDDAEFLLYLADRKVISGSLDEAQGIYAKVLKHQPRNIAALNNTAWLLAQKKSPEAVGFAERAVGLQPENPSLLDTLAFSLGSVGQHDRAISVAQRALVIAPEASAIRLTLARLYVDSGRKEQAMSELKRLSALGSRFDGQPVVNRLLKSLGA